MPLQIMTSASFNNRWIPLFTPILLLFFLSCFANAETEAYQEEINNLVPAHLLKWNNGPDHVVLVDKSKQLVMVYERNNPYQPYRVYNCSTGENHGPKTKRNDSKTPEGIYFFTSIHHERELTPIYGTRALPIDYPNPLDRKKGNGGYGIWFHGINKPLKPYDSNGCIAMENHDIEELADIVNIFDTPIIISEEIRMLPAESILNDRSELITKIENWRAAWQEKEIDKYISLYSTGFTSVQGDLNQYRDYKSSLADRYREINVEIEDLNIFTHEDIVVATFMQSYRTHDFGSYGKKTLYMTLNSNQWKIIGENFTRIKDLDPIPAKIELFDIKLAEEFIFNWKEAWENKELDRYISYYDKNFNSQEMDLTAWREHKDILNRTYAEIRVNISDIEIKQVSDNSASVRFMQHYTSDHYSDRGIKNILLIRKDKDWKISREEWTPIR